MRCILAGTSPVSYTGTSSIHGYDYTIIDGKSNCLLISEGLISKYLKEIKRNFKKVLFDRIN